MPLADLDAFLAWRALHPLRAEDLQDADGDRPSVE
jgi:hypothetical protein